MLIGFVTSTSTSQQTGNQPEAPCSGKPWLLALLAVAALAAIGLAVKFWPSTPTPAEWYATHPFEVGGKAIPFADPASAGYPHAKADPPEGGGDFIEFDDFDPDAESEKIEKFNRMGETIAFHCNNAKKGGVKPDCAAIASLLNRLHEIVASTHATLRIPAHIAYCEVLNEVVAAGCCTLPELIAAGLKCSCGNGTLNFEEIHPN